MPRMNGVGQTGGGGYSPSDFYATSRSSLPVYHAKEARISGQSQYASPEAEQIARPYGDIGKVGVSMFDAGTTQPPGLAAQQPKMPGAFDIMSVIRAPWMDAQKGESLQGVPGAGILAGGIDLLANLSHSANEDKPGFYAQQVFDKLKNTPDGELKPFEREIKSLNQGLFAAPPDSPMMQGKQVSEVYKAYMVAEGRSRGTSNRLLTDTLGDNPEFGIVGGALQGYGMLSAVLRRALGGATDQLEAVKKGTPEELGEERQTIREQMDRGELTDAEASDAIAMSSFALSNPNPVKLGSEFGPLDTVANAALALAGEVVSDPLTVPAAIATGGGYLAKAPITTTLSSILRTGGRAIAEAEAKNIGKVVTEEMIQSGISQLSREAAGRAAAKVAGTTFERNLPREATALAKRTGQVPTDAVTASDRLEALLDIGADTSHPASEAIKLGIQQAGTSGWVAVKSPRVIRMATAVDKMTDPFSLYGYWKAGRTVPMALSKQASEGAIDAIGWRVARRLDKAYADAGVPLDTADRARNVATANHVVQVGDAANTQRMVSANSALNPEGMTPTQAALQHAERRGDIRQLTRHQVDRTLEFIVPAGRGGRAEMERMWRDRAVKQLKDMGGDEAAAREVVANMEEREMRALANDHYGYIIDTFDAAKRAAQPTAKWDIKGIARMTFMGPRQISQQDAAALLKAIEEGNADVVRTAIRRFNDLNRHIAEDLDDAELLKKTKSVLGQLDGRLPVKVEDMTDIPPELAQFVADHPGYNIMLRPDDNNLLVPVRDAEGRITSVNSWVDNVTERTPSVEIKRFKAWREDTLRGIAGGELERNASRRFTANMADWEGLSETESKNVLRAIREAAEIDETAPRGLSTRSIIKAVDNAVGLSPARKQLAKRSVIDAVFDAYENEMRLVGVLPKLTGWVKTQATALPGGNSLGWMSDNLYGKVRFTKNPLFFLQELPEAPFFLALQGRYPVVNIVPDVAANALGPLGRPIREAKAELRIWNDKTLIVMERMTKMSPNADYDSYEAAELVRMGLTQAGQITEARTPLGRLLKKIGTEPTPLPVRKQRNVALAARGELGETWKRSLQRNAPEQWDAVRAFYPDNYSDGEVAVQWALDLFARADPDSIYSTLSPGSFRPSHIGARAEVSDQLIRHFVYGDQADQHTWADMVQEIRDKTLSEDQVRSDLEAAGADPDYVERAMAQLTFGSPDEFYAAAVENGIHPDDAAAWRLGDQEAADLQDIPLHEYLTRNYTGRPLSTDQMGNVIGETLFDDIVASMKMRGKAIPDSDSAEVGELMRVSREFITGVLRPVDEAGTELAPIPAAMPRGTPINVRKAANKVRGWEKARTERAADRTLGRPPTKALPKKGEPVPGYTLDYADDPLQTPYIQPGETGYQATARASEIGVNDLRGVIARDAEGKPVGFVYAKLDPDTNTLQVSQSQVLEPHGRKGLGNWMYRELEEKTGATLMPVRDQSESARALWAQPDRPFGPPTRQMREYKTANEAGKLVPVGEVVMRNPNDLIQTGRIPERGEVWDAYGYLDTPDVEGGIREPIRVTPDGKIIDGNDRRMAAINAHIDVPVQVMDFPTGAVTPVETAKFGYDPRGNRTVPDGFTPDENHLYRTVTPNRIGEDWADGTYVAAQPGGVYAVHPDSVMLRTRRDIVEWEPAKGGLDPDNNLTSRGKVWGEDVEYFGADKQWHPVIPPAAEQPLYQSAMHTVGVTTPRQYQRQIETMMDPVAMSKRGMRAMTEKDARLAIDWYDHMRRVTFALVDDGLEGDERIMEAARILIAFGTTQLNTSPADGFRHVFKAYGMKARGEELQLGEARNIVQQAVGLNPEQLHALVWGEGSKIEQMGIAQKLYDFIDSLIGSKTRTNGITGPRGDWGPVAVDVHTKRDFGFLDPAMGDWVYRLVERQEGETLVRGVSSKFVKEGGAPGAEYGHFVVEMSDGTTEVIPRASIGTGVPTDHEYDYGVELANDIRDHFNEIKFMDREWNSYEVQALGWYRMQLLKSSEGDAGEVANAVFEQSRWLGSNDLVPSERAPINQQHPWDDVAPHYVERIVSNAAHHASDEAEMASGARVLTKTDYDAIHGGQVRPATTVELATDVSGVRAYLAHYGLTAEQDSVMMMRDYTGTTSTPRYAKPGQTEGVGISVDIPVRDAEHASELMGILAGEEGGALRAIGTRTYVAPAADGTLHLRTFWEPSGPKADRNAFNKAVKDSGLAAALEEASPGTKMYDTLVDYVRMDHDWGADPTGKTYMDEIVRGGHRHPVIRTPEQREALVAQYDAAYQAALKSGDAKAIKAAKKEMEVARATPRGRPEAEVRELVGQSRLRVRTGVTADFDKYASREVRHARERVLGEVRDGATDLGTDPRWSDVLDRATASNGERLFDRSPGGTVRAAITRADSDARRSQLYFNRGAVTSKSLVHEIFHKEAWKYDDSANRLIAGQHAGLEGTPYGEWTPGTPLTEAQHEWLVSQYMLWAENEGAVHPAMAPLLKHLHGSLGSQAKLRTEATAPTRAAVKQIDAQIRVLKGKKPTPKITQQIADLTAQKAAAQTQAKTLRATGGLSPEVKQLLDDLAAKAGQRTSTRVSTFNADEQNMLEWAQISMASAQRRANDLVHMRGERSMFERSINHPFLGLYPSSYMYGKVLPYLTEFLMARPFGLKAPFSAYTVGQHMNQSFNRQQQYDPELRKFLYKNEPFLRALSMFVPGVPWDLPSGAPYWMRRITENWMTNQVRKYHGQKEQPLDIMALIMDSAIHNVTLRGTDSIGPIVQGVQQAPTVFGGMTTGETPDPALITPQPQS